MYHLGRLQYMIFGIYQYCILYTNMESVNVKGGEVFELFTARCGKKIP